MRILAVSLTSLCLYCISFWAADAPAKGEANVAAQAKLKVERDRPYAERADPRQKVDIYAPDSATHD